MGYSSPFWEVGFLTYRKNFGTTATMLQIVAPHPAPPVVNDATENKPCYGLQSVVDDEEPERRLQSAKTYTSISPQS